MAKKKKIGKLKKLLHKCKTNDEDILYGGDGTQYCSICGKQISGPRRKEREYPW